MKIFSPYKIDNKIQFIRQLSLDYGFPETLVIYFKSPLPQI